MLTVGDLRELIDALHDDVEVRLAMQPSWPFEYSVRDDVCIISNDEDLTEDEEAEPTVLYLVEDKQLRYLPGLVASQIGWK